MNTYISGTGTWLDIYGVIKTNIVNWRARDIADNKTPTGIVVSYSSL